MFGLILPLAMIVYRVTLLRGKNPSRNQRLTIAAMCVLITSIIDTIITGIQGNTVELYDIALVGGFGLLINYLILSFGIHEKAEIIVKKPWRPSTAYGIGCVILQGIALMSAISFENKGMVSAAEALTEQKDIAAGISPTVILIGDILGTVASFWVLILGLLLIFIPRIDDRTKIPDHILNKSIIKDDSLQKIKPWQE